jgi:hypothetical protein
MIGGCIALGKYNQLARWYSKSSIKNESTGQVKAYYPGYVSIDVMARGLTNLRGKDSGSLQDYGNLLDEYHYLRVKTMAEIKEGDVLAKIQDSAGGFYLSADTQFVVLGVTPTYDPFGSFIEYDVLCNKGEVTLKLIDNDLTSSDSTTVVGSS